MATIHLYNHTLRRFAAGQFPATDTFRLQLLNDQATFNGAHTQLASVNSAGTYEVHADGNGWPTGGFTLLNVAIETVDTDDCRFTADNIVQAISGQDLGPFSNYVIYDDDQADDPPVCFVALSAPQTITDGNSIGFTWSADGIIKWQV